MLTVIVWRTSQASSWTISLEKRISNLMEWREYNEEKRNFRKEEEPKRFKYFKDTLEEHPIRDEIVIIKEDKTMVTMEYEDYKINYFPFTGWWQGNKDFSNGRGIEALFKRFEEV